MAYIMTTKEVRLCGLTFPVALPPFDNTPMLVLPRKAATPAH